VALDVLSLTPFYQAFLITASVPAICPNLLGQKFVDPPFEEEILTFIRELGYSGNIKLLSDVKVDLLPQPWRTFGTIINKCLSDLVFQIENKELKKNKYLYYPRFTKVTINHFMSQDQSIPKRNKVDWHMANDGPILTIMRFIPQHEVVQKYGAIIPDNLTTPAMKESEAYKTYYAFATKKTTPKPKYVRQTSKEKTEQAPKATLGKRLKATAKVTRSGKKKQPAEGLETLSEITLSEAEQMKLAIKRSKTQLHSSQSDGSGTHEGTRVTPGVLDVPTYRSDDEEISWKSSDEDDDNEDDDDNTAADDDDNQDDDDERTESDNEGDDFVHPKFTTYDSGERHDDEEGGYNVEEEKINDEITNEEEEANDLYKDVNVNLEGRDINMTDASQMNVQAGQTTEVTHVIIQVVNPEV
ncbi:transposon TX1 uncharacterized, partial [Tanacetum coccineum]